MQAKERLERKIELFVKRNGIDQDRTDREVGNLSADELLTAAQLPINSKLRTYISGCLLRDEKRKWDVESLARTVKEDRLVPVEVQGGGKCKITIYMTEPDVNVDADAYQFSDVVRPRTQRHEQRPIGSTSRGYSAHVWTL
jgi:hypothetical protein